MGSSAGLHETHHFIPPPHPQRGASGAHRKLRQPPDLSFQGLPFEGFCACALLSGRELQGVFISSHGLEFPVKAWIWISRGKSSRFSRVFAVWLARAWMLK